MKAATAAPAYVALYPILAEVTREHGYALAIHGSVARDFGLIAVPWVSDPLDPVELVREVAERCQMATGTGWPYGYLSDEPEERPHGRLVWTIGIGCGASLDFGVLLPIGPPVPCHDPGGLEP